MRYSVSFKKNNVCQGHIVDTTMPVELIETWYRDVHGVEDFYGASPSNTEPKPGQPIITLVEHDGIPYRVNKMNLFVDAISALNAIYSLTGDEEIASMVDKLETLMYIL